MDKKILDRITDDQKSLKDLPNQTLISNMDLLTQEFEMVKENLINQTKYLDYIEILYNNILKEFQSRNDASTR